MIRDEIREKLSLLQDPAYKEFMAPLLPSLERDRIIGVRTPALRKYAKELAGRDDAGEFLSDLPHRTFEENQLHAFILCEGRDFGECVRRTDRFLPYVDNWATCDQMSPKIFRKNRAALLPFTEKWLESGHTYTVRYGIGMLMQHFLDEDFDLRYPGRVAEIRTEEYYVNMMIAWYFATALAKQYDAVLPFLSEGRLDTWTHNKTIRKAVESYRISPERKAYLKTLVRRGAQDRIRAGASFFKQEEPYG